MCNLINTHTHTHTDTHTHAQSVVEARRKAVGSLAAETQSTVEILWIQLHGYVQFI